jgi:hypothetical protein
MSDAAMCLNFGRVGIKNMRLNLVCLSNQTCVIRSKTNIASVQLNVVIDEGSDSILISSSCASTLKLCGDPQILQVDGVVCTCWSTKGRLGYDAP